MLSPVIILTVKLASFKSSIVYYESVFNLFSNTTKPKKVRLFSRIYLYSKSLGNY